MDNLSQNDFDKLFREGSEKVEFEYREDAWAVLDERLEEKKRKRRVLWILWGLGLSIIVIGSMFYYFNNPQNGLAKNGPTQENIAVTELQKETATKIASTEIISPISEEITNSSQIVDRPIVKKNTVRETVTQQATNTDFTQKTNSIKPEQTNYTLPILSDEQKKIIPFKENLEQEIKQYIQNVAPSIDKPTELSFTEEIAPIAGLSLQKIANEIERNIDEFSKIIKAAKKPKSQFSFGAFASIDYNSLSLSKDKIEQGYRIGLRTDYNFAKRFSLGIGAAFSRKTYTAQGYRYNAKPGFWTDGIAPIEVSANCNVIEIPIELRFYTRGHNQDGFFAGTGINSYHIALEQYDFHYVEILGNTITDWEERGTNTNLFSVATFTFGYQKTVNNNLIFQIAPYVNLPFTGIGQGKVNLQSAGLNVALNWRK